MERPPNRINTAARLVVAVYAGALLAGPAPFGIVFLGLLVSSWIPGSVGVFAIGATAPIVFAIPWIAVGTIAGKRVAALSGALAFLLWQMPLLAPEIPKYGRDVFYLSIGAFMGAAFAVAVSWIAAQFAIRHTVAKRLDGWRGWGVVALVVLLILVYTGTIGRNVAAHSLQARFPSEFPAGKNRTIRACGVYIGIDGQTGGDFPDVYYTDPSGLVFLGKYCD